MGYKKITVGADRFLALNWANYAFELFQIQEDQDYLYESLKSYLDGEIEGEETSRKTANQLKRLWLVEDDFQQLRLTAQSLKYTLNPEFMSILHLGMAMNVFPIYRETLRAIGLLDRIINPIPKQSIRKRVLEMFGNTASIPRAVDRVLQTLEDWQFIDLEPNKVVIRTIALKDDQFAAWCIAALIFANNSTGINLSDLAMLPEKLGIQIADPRGIIQTTNFVKLSRNSQGLEIITVSH